MTRIISVIGGKGGIGKTTLVSNLSSSLSSMGYKVIAVDGNLTTPNLSLHLGYQLSPKTIHDVLRGTAGLSEAIYPHPMGFSFIPASMSIDDLRGVDIGKFAETVSGLNGKADFVIIDSAAGLGREAISSVQAADEILLITNPEIPAVADTLKTAKLAKDFGKPIIGVVVNKHSGKWHQMTSGEVEDTVGHRVISEIPEDISVKRGIKMKTPAVELYPKSPASLAFKHLAHTLVGKEFEYPRQRGNFIERLAAWIAGY